MVFHASLAGRELPGWSRCMSPALLTSFLDSAFLFYILIATAMKIMAKNSLPLVSILVHLVSPSKPGLAPLPSTPVSASRCSLLSPSTPPSWRAHSRHNLSTPYTTVPPGLEGKSKWIATQRRDKTDGSLCLFCLAQGSLANKASNEDNDE